MDKKRVDRILRNAVGELIGLVLIATSWILGIAGIFNPVSSIIFVVLGFLIIAFVLLRKYYLYERKIDTFENARPNIIVKKVYQKRNIKTTDFVRINPNPQDSPTRDSGGTGVPAQYLVAYRDIYGTTNGTTTETIEQTYIVIDFANNPERRVEVHDAIDVIARINYFDERGNNILGREIKGLWEGVEPTRISQPKPNYELTQTIIPSNGDERSLCIGIKYRNDQDCYAYALESYSNTEFLKNENLNLKMGIARVEIVLSGRNLDSTKPFIFRLINPGIGRDILVTEIKTNEINEKEDSVSERQ
jgi:hypothetical protein